MILAKAELVHPKNQATTALFILQKLYSWRACSHKRNAFKKKMTTEPGVWRKEKSKTQNEWSWYLFPQFPSHHFPLSCLLSFLHWLLQPVLFLLSSKLVIVLLIFVILGFDFLNSSRLRILFVLSCFSNRLFPSWHFSSLSLLFVMSLWPWSHFPNWLSGSLIIL